MFKPEMKWVNSQKHFIKDIRNKQELTKLLADVEQRKLTWNSDKLSEKEISFLLSSVSEVEDYINRRLKPNEKAKRPLSLSSSKQ